MHTTQIGQVAQTSLMPDMGTIARLEAELERERTKRKQAETQVLMMRAEVAQAQKEARERIARAEAEIKQRADAALSDELMKIITTKSLNPTQRVILGMIYHSGRELQAKGKPAVLEMSSAQIADRLGVTKPTVLDALKTLKNAKLCEAETKKYMCRGEEVVPNDEVPAGAWKNKAVRKAHNLHIESDSFVSPVTVLPETIQKPEPTQYQAKAKAKASELRALAKVATKAEAATCPVCGKSECIHLVCDCGAVLTAEKLAKMAIEADESEQAHPDTIEAVRSSNRVGGVRSSNTPPEENLSAIKYNGQKSDRGHRQQNHPVRSSNTLSNEGTEGDSGASVSKGAQRG